MCMFCVLYIMGGRFCPAEFALVEHQCASGSFLITVRRCRCPSSAGGVAPGPAGISPPADPHGGWCDHPSASALRLSLLASALVPPISSHLSSRRVPLLRRPYGCEGDVDGQIGCVFCCVRSLASSADLVMLGVPRFRPLQEVHSLLQLSGAFKGGLKCELLAW